MEIKNFIKRTALLLAAVCCMTACRTVDYDHPVPTYMDSVAGISMQPIHAIQYYVGPLWKCWMVTFTNSKNPVAIGRNKKQWTYRTYDDSSATPLSECGSLFFERHGITVEQFTKIMEYVSANGIPLLCGPSYPRWEDSAATAIYEYRDDSLHERLLLFDVKNDSIRFYYDKRDRDISMGRRGYARLVDRSESFMEYLYDEGFLVTIRFSADMSQCLSVNSGDKHDGRHNPYLNSRQPMKKLP